MRTHQKFRRSVVIPYFNELKRFPLDLFIKHTKEMSNTAFVLVDDGSTDGLTPMIVELLKIHRLDNVTIIVQKQNLGKASSLHTGFTFSLSMHCSEIGFLDADFSTSIEELVQLFDIMSFTDSDAVIRTRQSASDNTVESELYRLIAGKIFAAFVRLYFRINLLDTQCGAKVFKVNKTLLNSLQQPIINPWLYDLQLILPIIYSKGLVTEVRLKKWINGPESKFNTHKGLHALFKLRQIKIAVNKSIQNK